MHCESSRQQIIKVNSSYAGDATDESCWKHAPVITFASSHCMHWGGVAHGLARMPSSAAIRKNVCREVPLISDDDFVALSLAALQGVSSVIYSIDTIKQKKLQFCNFILHGRSASSISKYQYAFSESFYIRVLLGSAQEAFASLSVDCKSPNTTAW